MVQRKKAWINTAIVLLGTLILFIPCWINGAPFMASDSGDYLYYSKTFQFFSYRSNTYGYFLWFFFKFGIWGPALAQNFLIVFLSYRLFQANDLRKIYSLFLFLISALTFLSPLPFVSNTLLADIFLPISLICLVLILYFPQALYTWERWLYGILFFYFQSTHLSYPPTYLLLLTGLFLTGWYLGLKREYFVNLIVLLVGTFGIVFLFFSLNIQNGFGIRYSNYSYHLVLSRLQNDGLLDKTLSHVCRNDPHFFQLCSKQQEIKKYVGEHLIWLKESPLLQILPEETRLNEAKNIVWKSLITFPLENIYHAGKAALLQLVSFRPGDGMFYPLGQEAWIFQVLKNHYPEYESFFQNSLQQNFFWFTYFSRLHYLFLLSLFIPLILFFRVTMEAFRKKNVDAVALASYLIFICLWANAIVCGFSSTPAPRLQQRIDWLVIVFLFLLIATSRKEKRPS